MNNLKRGISIEESLEQGLWFVPLGGAGEIGMNLNVYVCDDEWLVVDLGVSFGDQSIPGVDIVMADPSFVENKASKLCGIVLTHAHEDHLGAVVYLWEKLKCPIYATPFTVEFLKQKLVSANLIDHVNIITVALGGKISIGPFSVEFISLTHSIPEPNALAIRTKHGNIFHTGDWKFDQNPIVGPVSDIAALERFSADGVQLLVGDSTNVFSNETYTSEKEVETGLFNVISNLNKKVVVACFASNLARILSICAVASQTDRSVCLIGASLWRIINTARVSGYVPNDIKFYEADMAAHLPDDKVLYICTGSQGEPRAALIRIAFGSHRDLKLLEGDTVVFSSRVIPGNEKAILKIQNQLIWSGVNVITSKDAPIHVSGHPGRHDIKKMYNLIKPHTVVPVHGEYMHMVEHANLAMECKVKQTLLVENGSLVKVAPGKPFVSSSVLAGRMAVDGGIARKFNDPILIEKKRVFYNGFVQVSLVLNTTSILEAPVQVTSIGLGSSIKCANDVLVELITIVIKDMKAKDRLLDNTIVDRVSQAVRRVFKKEQAKRPLVSVHVIRI